MKSIANKRGQIATLQNIVISLVIVGIFIGLGFLILENFRDDMTAGSNAYDGVNDTITALQEIPSWLDTIVIIAIVGLMIYLVFAYLGSRRGTAV